MGEVKDITGTEGVPAKPEPVQAEVASSDSAEVTIPVENYLPDDTPTYYSDGMLVLHSANEFIISFLQTQYPLAGSKEDLQQVQSVKRKCVAQVIVSPTQFEAVTRALQENLKKYQDSYRKPEPESS